MDFSQNYFQIFGLPQSFSVDTDLLAKNYRQLHKELHPDKFASKTASEQRLAVQFASHINSAYQTLKSPLSRAEYLLELSKCPVNSETLTVKDTEFLLKQMEWRETLADLSADAKSVPVDRQEANRQLYDLQQEVDQKRNQLLDNFDASFQQEAFSEAIEQVAQLHFVEKARSSIEDLEHRLLN